MLLNIDKIICIYTYAAKYVIKNTGNLPFKNVKNNKKKHGLKNNYIIKTVSLLKTNAR